MDADACCKFVSGAVEDCAAATAACGVCARGRGEDASRGEVEGGEEEEGGGEGDSRRGAEGVAEAAEAAEAVREAPVDAGLARMREGRRHSEEGRRRRRPRQATGSGPAERLLRVFGRAALLRTAPPPPPGVYAREGAERTRGGRRRTRAAKSLPSFRNVGN